MAILIQLRERYCNHSNFLSRISMTVHPTTGMRYTSIAPMIKSGMMNVKSSKFVLLEALQQFTYKNIGHLNFGLNIILTTNYLNPTKRAHAMSSPEIGRPYQLRC